MSEKNLLVCENSKYELKKINESEGDNKGYFLEGVFAELDTLNRNKRIYPKDEYLKHLAYLRDDIKKGETLLGELDHPDDRFEVKLKEASHKIVDLWYDANTNCVMGKIELLNTPNGKLAQSLIDQGIPLHISSRAAGTVGNDNKVSIQQIYTYDLVCKPGFAGAVLHRVNESASAPRYNEETNKFFVESNRSESMNIAPFYGINESEISIREVSFDATLRKEAASIKENNEDNMNTDNMTEDDLEEKKKVAPAVKQNLKPVFEEGEDEDNDKKDSEETDDKKDTDDKGVEIVSVRAEIDGEDEEGVDIKDVKADNDEETEDENSDKEDEDKNDNEESEKSDEEKNECDKSESDESGDNSSEEDRTKPDETDCDIKKRLFDCDDIKKKQDNFKDKLDSLIDDIKRKNKKNEANESEMLNKYPTFCMLNKSNRAEVMKLDESQKNKVAAYVRDHNICTPDAMNESWKKGLDYEVPTENWLRYAPKQYREIFENQDENVQKSIRENASYFLFENQYDINNFWESTGLLESEERKHANEKFISNMPKLNEGVDVQKNDNGLPYSKEFIDMITEMACEYN